MFFILSKLLIIFLKPLTWILILLLLSVIFRKSKWGKRTFVTGLIMLAIFSNDFIINEILKAWEYPPTAMTELEKEENRAGIVLGGFLNSELEPKDRPHLNASADRIVLGIMLYHQGYHDLVIVSGGNATITGDEDDLEADATRPLLDGLKVPDSAYILDNQARNTYENAVEVAKILEQKALKDKNAHILITSAFHMPRALLCFKKQNVNVIPFAVDYKQHDTYYTPDSLLIPSASALTKWDMLLKEWVGILTYKILGYI